MAGTDILLKDGDIDLTDDIMRLTPTVEDFARQRVSITLRTYRGEWAWNINLGIPYLANANNAEQLLGRGGSKSLLDHEIRKAVLAKEEILRITDYTSLFDPRTRRVDVSFVAHTETGEIRFTSEPI